MIIFKGCLTPTSQYYVGEINSDFLFDCLHGALVSFYGDN